MKRGCLVLAIIVPLGVCMLCVLAAIFPTPKTEPEAPTSKAPNVESPPAKKVDPFASLPRAKFYPASFILNSYEANELRGAQTFNDKVIPLTGAVKDISSDILGSPYILLESGNPAFGVQCMFDRSMANVLAQGNKGDVVFVVGRVQGKALNVVVVDCRFVKPID